MFLKILVSIFSIAVLIKNFSYAKYELKTNQNILGAISVSIFSFTTMLILNIVLFFIKF